MKRILIATLALVAFAGLGFADEQQDQNKKSPPKRTSQAQQAQPTTRSTSSSARQIQSRQRTNPVVVHSKPTSTVNTGATARTQATSARTSAHAQTVNRTVQPSNTATVSRSNSRAVTTNAATVNRNNARAVTTNRSVNRNVVLSNTSNRHFVRSVSGPHVSFTTAREFNWRTHHDRIWWTSHYNRFVIYGGGYYFWNNGWWYPAYGYNPYYNSYPYDGPIFGYGYASPGDVTAQVQQVLAQQGYYQGPIDGILGPGTRDAIAQWQADHGLVTTAAIDEQTLGSLGLA